MHTYIHVCIHCLLFLSLSLSLSPSLSTFLTYFATSTYTYHYHFTNLAGKLDLGLFGNATVLAERGTHHQKALCDCHQRLCIDKKI